LIGTYATYIFESPLEPYSTVGTLVFVMLITSVINGIDDFKRNQADEYENNRAVRVVTFNGDQLVEEQRRAKDIQVGDIVRVLEHEPLPVDLVILLTSLHTDANQCYIETANIDGETNLKLRIAPPGLVSLAHNGAFTQQLSVGSVEVELPNRNIHSFLGALSLPAAERTFPLSEDNFVLRASVLSNTEWYGCSAHSEE
jgi:phospholipid-transporting ATPase